MCSICHRAHAADGVSADHELLLLIHPHLPARHIRAFTRFVAAVPALRHKPFQLLRVDRLHKVGNGARQFRGAARAAAGGVRSRVSGLAEDVAEVCHRALALAVMLPAT